MKRKIFLLTIPVVCVGILAYLFRYVPVFYLQQNYNSENTSFTFYKYPWYYTDIVISTDPYIVTETTKINSWKWNIDIQGDVSVFPKVSIQIINAKTGKVITEKNVSYTPTPVPTQDNTLVIKINNNYPYMELFPYVSPTMVASYSGEPKNILITKKTNASSSALLQELDNYLKSKFLSLDDLEQKGVVFTFNQNIEPNAIIIRE